MKDGRGLFCSNICKYKFRKGRKPWNTGKKCPTLSASKTGSKNPMWKGGYDKKKSDREYAIKNREKIYKRQREWNASNRDKVKEWSKKWQRANPEKRALSWERRRLRELQLGGHTTREQWVEIKLKQKHRCLICKRKEPEIKLTIDHIIPVSRWEEWVKKNKVDYKCGDHENIQGLCRKCNTTKGQKLSTV